jgi:hypothetical protein
MKTIAVLAAVAVLALPAAAEAKSVKIAVGSSAVSWQSPEHFPAKSQMAITVVWGRFDLEMSGEGDCVAYFNGHGIAARVNFCGRRGRIPVDVRIVSAREKSTKVKITYEAF